MKQQYIHLIVEEGPDVGMEITIPPDGIRAGRSSKNDIVLKDPAMSRFHCRFFFKPGEGIWAEDLGSANQTMINGKPLREAQIHAGDRIIMGDTTIKVVSDHPPDTSPKQLFDAPATSKHHEKIEFRRSSPEKKGAKHRSFRVAFMILACLIALCSAVIWVYKIFQYPVKSEPVATEPKIESLEISYVKVQASTKNIFRYEMDLKNNELSIQINDLKNQRHVSKDQHKKVEPELIQNLIEIINNSDYFEMNEEYKGLPSDFWDMSRLSITIGRKTHRVKILNRTEPESFKNIREVIEEFGHNELGLTALALSHEKLLKLANEAWLLGQNLYDQRKVKNENLAQATRSLKETEWYLETIEPKPDYYEDAIALLGECEREQETIYERHFFIANRAVQLKDWNEAAGQLRTLCEKIPDRSDERHKRARKKLIDVERRLKKR